MDHPIGLLLAAVLLAPAFASAQTPTLDQLKGQSGGLSGLSAAPAVETTAVIRTMLVAKDGTPVLNAAKDPDGEAAYEDAYVAELRRGETVKVLGQIPGWYQVEINRRQFNSDAKTWENAKGWVKLGALVENAAALPYQTPAEAVNNIPLEPVDLPGDQCQARFIEKLKGFVGVPYKWGGTSHAGVDCSGLVQAAMLEAGCTKQTPPRTAAAQQQAAAPESAASLQPTDSVFVGTPAHHTFVVIARDGSSFQVIEAPYTGASVYTHAWSPSGGQTFGALLRKIERN